MGTCIYAIFLFILHSTYSDPTQEPPILYYSSKNKLSLSKAILATGYIDYFHSC